MAIAIMLCTSFRAAASMLAPGYGSWAYHSPQWPVRIRGFARLRLAHLPLSGESPTIHQHGRQLARGNRTLQSLRRVAPPRRFFLAWCASQSHANCLSSWSRRQDLNPRQADYRSAVLPLNYTGYGAGGRNRTPIPGLEGRCSTIELHPLRSAFLA